jgi:hypothetical protein
VGFFPFVVLWGGASRITVFGVRISKVDNLNFSKINFVTNNYNCGVLNPKGVL